MTVDWRFASLIGAPLALAACVIPPAVVVCAPRQDDVPPPPPPEPSIALPPHVSCNLGTVTGDPFGRAFLFGDGARLPAGHYRATFVDGCMKYNGSQGWTVNAYGLSRPDRSFHWWFVTDGHNLEAVLPPGNVGFRLGEGGFASFDECVDASRGLPPVDIWLPDGGTLGVWLEDSPYGDNLPGPSGRSPTWKLECVASP